MSTIKIRFIQYGKLTKEFTMQKKTWFSWKDITYTIDMGYGAIIANYTAKTKEDLLAEVLEKHYKTDKKFVRIIEYPGLQIY